MTKQDRQLLLKDLCARLPYGVMYNIMGLEHPLLLQGIFFDKTDDILLNFYEDGKNYQLYLSEVKPYLRPMSSMTNEEQIEFIDEDDYVDWLTAYHFDYRGLIEKGLALKAPEGMYN